MADETDSKSKIERKGKAGKKRSRNPAEWHKQKQKRLRIAGKEHINTNGSLVPAKTPGEDCRCRRRCFDRIPEPIRKKTFEGFYALKTHDEQNAYLFGLMRQVDIKRKRKKDSSRRTCTFEYFIRVRGRETQVCQLAFKNIHAITERKVRVLCKKMDDGVMFPSDNRGKNSGSRVGEVRLSQDVINQIKSHVYTIVHTHRLKDFIRVDKHTGLEINISKMWKDYIKIYDPRNLAATANKCRKKQWVDNEDNNLQSQHTIQTLPNTDNYCLAYPADNYITQTVIPPQYTPQQLTVNGYIIPDKMTYFSQGQVVVQPNVQTQSSHLVQQTFTQHEPNTFLIVHSLDPPVKLEQSTSNNAITTTTTTTTVDVIKTKKEKKEKKSGPLVKQWRYTNIFHQEINGAVLSAIKTRLPLYYNELCAPKKKKTPANKTPKIEVQQQQTIQQQQQQIQQSQHQTQIVMPVMAPSVQTTSNYNCHCPS